jgi:hypothetical protein
MIFLTKRDQPFVSTPTTLSGLLAEQSRTITLCWYTIKTCLMSQTFPFDSKVWRRCGRLEEETRTVIEWQRSLRRCQKRNAFPNSFPNSAPPGSCHGWELLVLRAVCWLVAYDNPSVFDGDFWREARTRTAHSDPGLELGPNGVRSPAPTCYSHLLSNTEHLQSICSWPWLTGVSGVRPKSPLVLFPWNALKAPALKSEVSPKAPLEYDVPPITDICINLRTNNF